MSPENGFSASDWTAAARTSRSRAGSFCSAFSTRLAILSVQPIEEFVEGYEFTLLDLRPAARHGRKLGFRRGDHWEAAVKIPPQRFAHQLGVRAVLFFADALHLLDHRLRERNGHGLPDSCHTYAGKKI